MGRGDKRTAKGKRTRGSYGKSRDKDQLKARARKAPQTAADFVQPAAEAPAEAPAPAEAQAEAQV